MHKYRKGRGERCKWDSTIKYDEAVLERSLHNSMNES